MARPPVGRVVTQLCRCGSEVLTARHVLDPSEVVGAETRFCGPREAAEAFLAGRPVWELCHDHEGHSWLTPCAAPGLRRRLLGEQVVGLLTLDHVCSAGRNA